MNAGLENIQKLSIEYWGGLNSLCDKLLVQLAESRESGEDISEDISQMRIRETVVGSTQSYYSETQQLIRKIFKQAKKFQQFIPVQRTFTHTHPLMQENFTHTHTPTQGEYTQLIEEYLLFHNMDWYSQFRKELGESAFYSKEAVDLFSEMHALIAHIRDGHPGPALEWLESHLSKEPRLGPIIIKIVKIFKNLSTVKKYWHLVKSERLTDLLLGDTSGAGAPQADIVPLMWRAFSWVNECNDMTAMEHKRVCASEHANKRVCEKPIFEAEANFLYSDYISSNGNFVDPEVCTPIFGPRVGFVDSETSDLPHIATNSAPLFVKLDDGQLDDCMQNLAVPRTAASSRSGSVHPRFYPYNQSSREWLIRQVGGEKSTPLAKVYTDATTQVGDADFSVPRIVFPPMSRLESGVCAGIEAFPKLLALSAVDPLWWKPQTVLPVEIDIEHSMHSFIACPISRLPCPVPVVLACGHVIANTVLASIVQASRGRNLKCPICPQEISHETTVNLRIPSDT